MPKFTKKNTPSTPSGIPIVLAPIDPSVPFNDRLESAIIEGEKIRAALTGLDTAKKALGPHAEVGKKILDTLDKGRKSRAGEQHGERERKKKQYQCEIDRLHKLHPRKSFDWLTREAAKTIPQSSRTIRRYTQDPIQRPSR